MFCVWASFVLLFCFCSVHSLRINFVVLTQQSEYELTKAKALKQQILSQSRSAHLKTSVYFSNEFPGENYGHWSLFPLFERIYSSMVESNAEWLIVLEPETFVKLSLLNDFLSNIDHTETHFIGYGLHDKSPTIIHHFYGYDQEELFEYPDFAAGVALSAGLIKKITEVLRLKSAPRNDFSIDAKHENMDDMDLEMEMRRAGRVVGRTLRDRTVPFEKLDDEAFRLRFRLTRRTFFETCEWIEETMDRKLAAWNNPLSTAQLLGCGILSIATPQFQLATADLLNVSQSSVSRAVTLISDLFAANSGYFISFPDQQEMRKIALRYFQRCGIPGVVGVVDGSHIPIQAPGIDEDSFLNRKGYHSINLSAICDDNLRIRWASSKYPGRCHDSRVFRESALYKDFEAGRIQGIILGDSAYRLENFLLKPILGEGRTPKEMRFTEALCSARVDVEHCFGVMKRQFHALHAELRYEPDRASKLIIFACCLRNKCIDQREPDFDDELSDDSDDESDSEDEESPAPPPSGTARARMEKIIDQYF